MNYDIAIIGWWATWLFCSIFLPKNMKKIIFEKNKQPWRKLLLSWWERCNVTNINIDPYNDYFWTDKPKTTEIIKKFSNKDMIKWLKTNNVPTTIEDRWRVILASWNAEQLLKILIKKAQHNWNEIVRDQEIIDIDKKDWTFIIIAKKWQFKANKIIISTWWRSFSQIWTNWWWYRIAEKFWIWMIKPYKWLCWIKTKKDVTKLAWTSQDLKLEIIDKNQPIYQEIWPLLFTHWWISWPIVFNAVIRIWEYLRQKWISPQDDDNYITNNLHAKLIFHKDFITKKVRWFFENWLDDSGILLELENIRSWSEAKITWWWVLLSELNDNFESKKVEWLYFIWEMLDITWKTGWYNLQVAWSSWYICWNSFK